MPTITVAENVTFHYTDSGPVDQSNDEYITIIIVHGHSFHSGIFMRILPLANFHGYRIICISRRPYQGSTPYTPEETEIVQNGSEEQCAAFLHSQGVLLALFVDGIIQKHALPKKGGIALVGWSLGNVFTLAALAAIRDLPSAAKERLKSYLHSYVCWDAPFSALGIPEPEGSYIPLWDPSIAPQDRGAVFGVWASGYFQHGDQTSEEYSHLNQRDFDTQARKPTLTRMTDNEVHSTIDISFGAEFDTPIVTPGTFEIALHNQTSRALFDLEIRKEWPHLKISMMYCENTIWVIIYAMWELKRRASQTTIDFKCIPDANHFLMWDDPERFMISLKECISKS